MAGLFLQSSFLVVLRPRFCNIVCSPDVTRVKASEKPRRDRGKRSLTNSASLKRWLPGEVEGGQQLTIMIDAGILRRQKFVSVKDRVSPSK
jgi:hypothetical protein